MSKIDKLLAVLDMLTSEQYKWCIANTDLYPYESLADLAFWLRDEVLSSKYGTLHWVSGMFDVYMKMTGSKLLNWKWGYIEAKPIHWIIAALIAKELEKKND